MPTSGEEVITYYSVAGDNSWSQQQTTSTGPIYKELYATTGWQNGLTTGTEEWSGGVKKKWTTLSWTQDDTNLTFQKNPRVTETNIYDIDNNHKRVTMNYGSYTLPNGPINLPAEAIEYDANGTTILRKTLTDYNFGSAYTDRRIIGLVSAIQVSDATSILSKTTFEYDESGFLLAQSAIQHDSANYGGTSFTARGNLTTVKRWDSNSPTDSSKAISQRRTGYNSTGSPVFFRDALSHQTTVNYTDSFSDASKNGNTFAYPTTVTDADSFSSTVQYNFDFGAVTRTQDPNGAVQTMAYDATGRISKVTNAVNNAFTEWVYPNTMTEINQHTTISDGSIANAAQRAFSTTLFDGSGRVRYVASDLPPTAGRFRAQRFIYDNMGRVVQQIESH